MIHETLVDLLKIQREIHPGVFAVTDGTFAGDGPGPRAMRWHMKNVLLASADQVAVDAVAAKMMGFDPMSIGFIRMAHEQGLGCGRVEEIEVVGEDISEIDWQFSASENTLASRGQKLIYWGPLKSLERILLRSPLTPWAYLASNLYHNEYWLRFIGRRRVRGGDGDGLGPAVSKLLGLPVPNLLEYRRGIYNVITLHPQGQTSDEDQTRKDRKLSRSPYSEASHRGGRP